MSAIKCFMLTPTDRAARFLRRFWSVDADVRLCEPQGYHDEAVRIDDTDLIRDGNNTSIDPMTWPEDDPRWPERCHCGYEFGDKETRQLFYLPIYRTPDGREVTIHRTPPRGIEAAPAGSMWFADWLIGTDWTGPDGHSLVVRTPGGDWTIDGPSTNGPGWTREGVPPLVTARPSILIADRYHGFLTNGELVAC